MLETPQERVRLLKAGIDGKTIEKMYIILNNLTVAHTPLRFEKVEINTEENTNSATGQGKMTTIIIKRE